MFLDQIENNGNHLIAAQELSESAALTKLENEEISGIYQVGSSSSLTVASNGIPQSILQSILSGYGNRKKHHPLYSPHTSIRSVGRNTADAKSTGNTY